MPFLRRLGQLFLLVVLLSQARVAWAAGSISLEADNLEFSSDGQTVMASGHAHLVYQDLSLQAETLTRRGDLVTATGGVHFVFAQGELEAESIEVNLATSAYRAKKVRGRLASFYITSEEILPGESGEEILRNATLTRCSLEVPDYALVAGTITIRANRIEISQGWLTLRGRRILPLPRLKLDPERLQNWLHLGAGYGEEGLFIGLGLPIPLTERMDLAIDGTFATQDPVSLRAALEWQPNGQFQLSPWVGYSLNDGTSAGLGLQFTLAGLTASAELSESLASGESTKEVSLSGPDWKVAGGALSIKTAWKKTEASPDQTVDLSLTAQWRRPGASDGDSLLLALTAARLEEGGEWSSELRLHTEISRRLGPDWGIDLSLTYEIIGGTIPEFNTSLTRYLHCFFLRGGYDWSAGTFSFSGGIDF